MKDIHAMIQQAASTAIQEAYGVGVEPDTLQVQGTRKDFEGDYTLVIFPLARYKLGAPHEVAEALGKHLQESQDYIESYNVVKGFLNLSLDPSFWLEFLSESATDDNFHQRTEGKGTSVVVEYSSPNTNKPLHLGHLRNIVLGYSLNEVLKVNGYDSHPVCLYNDRGTAICQSMYAWQLSGKNETPESSGKKGDLLVGDYYVEFAQLRGKQVAELMAKGMSKEEATKEAPASKAINEMLIKWENNDPEIRALWKKMNQWVYDAHYKTYETLGVKFEKLYYESEVYKDGKITVDEGLEKGLFYKKDDGSVWVDLEDAGMDQKLLLRANGTSVYITQDLATAEEKYKDFGMEKSIYVVGKEQEYHFKVLFEVLKRLEKPYAKDLYHLSYGLVDLPEGRMKSREGTTVEADDLIVEVLEKVEEATQELGKIDDIPKEDLTKLYHTLGLGAIKYFLIKVDPKKGMVFDPKQSVDLQGNTAPFIQYSYTRTAAIQRKAGEVMKYTVDMPLEEPFHHSERILLNRIFRYPDVLKEAAETYNPSLIANYIYELAREYNGFFRDCRVIQSDKPNTSAMRFSLSNFTGKTIKAGMKILGIDVPERM